MFSVFCAESRHLHKKESHSCLCSLFYIFLSFFFFLKVFCFFFFIKDRIFGVFCLHFVHREKNISQLFFVNIDVSQAIFCQLCPLKHWILKFCCFFSLVLISCKNSRKSGSHVCDPSELAQSSFRTKKTVWKVAGVKEE